MSYQRKPGDGVLWKNADKKGETHPDMRGDLLAACPHCQQAFEMYVSAWTKAKRDGEKFLSLSAKSKTEGRAQADRRAPAEQFDDDSNLPFS